jgi:WD40 repeat protein
MITSIDTTPAQRQSILSSSSTLSHALTLHKTTRTIKPTYHAPWKLVRIISGHLGWVSVAVEPGHQWFATGAGDRVIKIWDLASGELKLSLTGHISTVRGLAVSPRHPYLFSCGEDKVGHIFTWWKGNLVNAYCRWSSAGISNKIRSSDVIMDIFQVSIPSVHTLHLMYLLPLAATPPPECGTCEQRRRSMSCLATQEQSRMLNAKNQIHKLSWGAWTRQSGRPPLCNWHLSF